MLAEKVRAISGQRRFAISRDLYDIHRLVQAGVSLQAVRQALPARLAAKGLWTYPASPSSAWPSGGPLSDWERRLAHLLPPQQPISFEDAWQSAIRLLAHLHTATN